MPSLPLVTFPDPRLKFVSEPVETLTDELRAFISDMFDTMYKEEGVGLAAVQVGKLIRVLVMDVEQGEDGKKGDPIAMINPTIIWESEASHSYQEGCLSFPELRADIVRPEEVKVTFLDEQGQQQERHFTGLAAVCMQHELDHLNGITFVDHLSKLKRALLLKKLAKRQKQEAI